MAGPVEYPEGVRADGLPAVLSDPDRLAAAVTNCGISAITFGGETRTFWRSVPHLPYAGVDQWQNAVGDDFCHEAALARTLAGSHGLDAAATVGHIASALLARHDGWLSDDTALLALRVPPSAAVRTG